MITNSSILYLKEYKLYMNNICIGRYETQPNLWNRFWQRLLLGWKWRRSIDE